MSEDGVHSEARAVPQSGPGAIPRADELLEPEPTAETLAVAGPAPAASPQAVLESFLAAATVRNERNAAVVRLVVCAVILAHVLIFREWGTGRWWTVGAGVAGGIAFSVWVLATLRVGHRLLQRLYGSVLLDGVIVLTGLMAWTIWPEEDHVGIFRRLDAAVLLLATIGTGFRLSRQVAILGSAMFLGVCIALGTADQLLNADLISYGAPDLFLYGGLAVGSALLAYFIAVRTKQLIYEGADASVQAERARQRLGLYVSEEVAADLIEQAELAMGGVRQPVAVLFSDLRGFTQYAEKISPERLVAELNDYLEVMVAVIRAEGGFVDKFIGDSIMAVFSVPKPQEDDAARAIRAAAGMQAALVEHNRHREERGLPPLQQGIGLHFGLGVVGNIGSTHKAQFTVMGDVVNLTSRLESATKAEGVSTLLSESIVERAQAVAHDGGLPGLRSHGRLSVRGRDASLEVFTLE